MHERKLTGPFDIAICVRQGCFPPPLLFILMYIAVAYASLWSRKLMQSASLVLNNLLLDPLDLLL